MEWNPAEYRWPLFRALGYAREIDTRHFGTRDYPAPEVRAFHESAARIKIALAPARTGKSYAGAHDILPDILDFNRPEKHLIVGPDYDKASKEFGYIADALVHNLSKLHDAGLPIPEPVEYKFSPKTGHMEIKWPWGAELHAKSAVHLRSVLGESWGAAILAEAAEIPPSLWYRGLSTRVRRAILPTTPGISGLWIKDIVDAAVQQNDSSVALFQFPPEANPIYDMDRFREELERRGGDDPYFREQFLGEWAFYGGRVFPGFQPEPVVDVGGYLRGNEGICGGDPAVCIAPLEIPRHWKRVAGIDFGWKDPTVFLWMAVAPNGDVIVYDEYYAAQRSTDHHITEIFAQNRRNGTGAKPPGAYREPKGQALQLSHDYAAAGLASIPIAHSDKLSSRLHVQHYLDADDTGLPRLRIVKENCPNLVRELVGLHYDKDGFALHSEGEQERYKGDDHAFDALRYALSSRPHPRRTSAQVDEKLTLDTLRKRQRHLRKQMGQIGARYGDVDERGDARWWRYT